VRTEPSTELSLDDARTRLAELQIQLASRRSTLHFAHCGTALVACAIFTAAAAKLFWDSIRFPVLGAAAVLVATALVIYAWLQYRRGQTHLRRELALFARLQEVHRALELDNPAALLPQ
jgi:hypothetical protein